MMTISVCAFTGAGNGIAERLLSFPAQWLRRQDEPLGPWAKQCFAGCDALVFIGAAGIAVRAIASEIRSKATDPAVLVIDELGRYVVPILSGHLGGANALAQSLAAHLGATPVITTATDVHGVFAADVWSVQNGCGIADTAQIRKISAALLRGEAVGLFSDFTVSGALPTGLHQAQDGEVGICISLDGEKRPFAHTLNLVPRIVTLGVGCRRGTALETLEALVLETLSEQRISILAVEALASIDLKRDEPCLLAFAARHGIPLRTYPAEALNRLEGAFTSSQRVLETTGTDNVCERSALLHSAGRIIMHKKAGGGVTLALAERKWVACF